MNSNLEPMNGSKQESRHQGYQELLKLEMLHEHQPSFFTIFVSHQWLAGHVLTGAEGIGTGTHYLLSQERTQTLAAINSGTCKRPWERQGSGMLSIPVFKGDVIAKTGDVGQQPFDSFLTFFGDWTKLLLRHHNHLDLSCVNAQVGGFWTAGFKTKPLTLWPLNMFGFYVTWNMSTNPIPVLKTPSETMA